MNRRRPPRRRLSGEVLEYEPSVVSKLTDETMQSVFGRRTHNRRLLQALRLAWVQELTPVQQKYLWLYYQYRMPLSQIAAQYSVHPATVSRTLKRARLRLHRVLQYYDNEEES